jgi:hypothetical protein
MSNDVVTSDEPVTQIEFKHNCLRIKDKNGTLRVVMKISFQDAYLSGLSTASNVEIGLISGGEIVIVCQNRLNAEKLFEMLFQWLQFRGPMAEGTPHTF